MAKPSSPSAWWWRPGLLGHEYRPDVFAGLPRELVSHSCEHTDSERYRGKRVAVIGRGQSACESAAILHEAGVDVELICHGQSGVNADPGQRSALRKAVRGLLGSMLIPPFAGRAVPVQLAE